MHQHVIPLGDLREHEPSADCWCHPVADDDEPSVYVHNALDVALALEPGGDLTPH